VLPDGQRTDRQTTDGRPDGTTIKYNWRWRHLNVWYKDQKTPIALSHCTQYLGARNSTLEFPGGNYSAPPHPWAVITAVSAPRDLSHSTHTCRSLCVKFIGEHVVQNVVLEASFDEFVLRQNAIAVGVHFGEDLSRPRLWRVVELFCVGIGHYIDRLQTGAWTAATSFEYSWTSQTRLQTTLKSFRL